MSSEISEICILCFERRLLKIFVIVLCCQRMLLMIINKTWMRTQERCTVCTVVQCTLCGYNHFQSVSEHLWWGWSRENSSEFEHYFRDNCFTMMMMWLMVTSINQWHILLPLISLHNYYIKSGKQIKKILKQFMETSTFLARYSILLMLRLLNYWKI